MTKEDLLRTIKNAEKIMESWPEWKKGILEDSMKAQWDTPRKPVNNFKCNKCGEPY